MTAQNSLTASPQCLDKLMTHTSDIVASYVSNNSLDVDEVGPLIQSVYASLSGRDVPAKDPRPDPAVPIRLSVKKDHIVCLEDGRKMKTLKRHLRTEHKLTPDEYRARWGLSDDYPMVAPNYAAQRSDMAKKIGLGRVPGQKRGRGKRAATGA